MLSAQSKDALGPAGSTLTFDGATLQVTGTTFNDLAGHAVTWGAKGGGIDIQEAANTLTVSDALNGGPLKVNELGGKGTLKLTASDTFTTTDVFSGALLIDGTNTLNSPVTVHAGGTLGGNDAAVITGNVTNAGTLAPGFGLTTAGSKMTIAGNYAGNGGTLSLNTQLGADSSPTDQLFINGGTTTGSTGIVVTNRGGLGALTTGLGIPIVVPEGGATIGAGTFGPNGSVVPGAAAGIYQYNLFQGTGGDTTYYLRSHGDSPPTPGGEPPPLGPPPLYRPEVSIFSAMPGLARQQELTTLGTFHERNGDQRLAANAGPRTAAWGRLFGEQMEQSHSGLVGASFDGSTGGLQSGVDAMQWVNASGHQDRLGMFAAYAHTTGTVNGFALGIPNAVAGRAELDGTSIGGYWTHLAPTGWYTDAVLMGTRFEGDGSA